MAHVCKYNDQRYAFYKSNLPWDSTSGKMHTEITTNKRVAYVGTTKTIIEPNGQHYNAPTSVTLAKSKNVKKTPSIGTHVDGFFRSTATLPVPTKRAALDRATKQPLQAHKPERTKTLMRHVVKKPVAAKKLPVITPAKASKPGIALHQAAEQQRVVRAQQIRKSPLVSRFGRLSAPSPVAKKTAHVPVRPAPAHSAPNHSPAVITPKQPISHHAVPTAHQRSSTPTPQPQQPFSLAHALEHAKSHEQPKVAKAKLHHRAARKLGVSPRAINLMSATMAVLLLVGFIAYQNVPNFVMQMAASKAGFHASLPGYKPSGFSMNRPVEAAPGIISVSFTSRSDNRNFSITQRPSTWTSQSLLHNVVANADKSYQTYEDRGKTIYIYQGSNATWVTGGVWYTVEGNETLSNSQLLRLANSM